MNKKIGNLFKGDKVIWMVFFFLCIISVIEVFSASSTLTYATGYYLGPITKHMGMLIAAIALAIIVLNVPCKYFKLLTPALLVASFATLLWVLIGGESINGANRVIKLAGFTFQPSEIAKGTMVLVTAQILSATQVESGADKDAFKYILWILLPMAFLIGLENLSTAGLLCIVIFIMMFLGRVPLQQLGKLLGVVAVLAVFGITFIMVAGKVDEDKKAEKATTEITGNKKTDEGFFDKLFHRAGTWKGRVNSFFEPEPAPEDYDLDKDKQVAHANIAITSSNIIGKGPGNSTERDFLPQAYSDFIYAIVIEEMGIVGAVAVVFLYIVLLFRAARIASRCENNFPAFLVMGLALLLVIQATFNMLVAVGLAPVTGQPLPLISRGGTSTIINGAYIGAILSVSRSAKKQKEPSANKKAVVAEEA